MGCFLVRCCLVALIDVRDRTGSVFFFLLSSFPLLFSKLPYYCGDCNYTRRLCFPRTVIWIVRWLGYLGSFIRTTRSVASLSTPSNGILPVAIAYRTTPAHHTSRARGSYLAYPVQNSTWSRGSLPRREQSAFQVIQFNSIRFELQVHRSTGQRSA